MNEQCLEEEIEVLECSYNNLDDIINMLKDLSSEKYGMIISQCQELLNEIDYVLTDKEEELNGLNINQLKENRLQRYEREINYKEKIDF